MIKERRRAVFLAEILNGGDLIRGRFQQLHLFGLRWLSGGRRQFDVLELGTVNRGEKCSSENVEKWLRVQLETQELQTKSKENTFFQKKYYISITLHFFFKAIVVFS